MFSLVINYIVQICQLSISDRVILVSCGQLWSVVWSVQPWSVAATDHLSFLRRNIFSPTHSLSLSLSACLVLPVHRFTSGRSCRAQMSPIGLIHVAVGSKTYARLKIWSPSCIRVSMHLAYYSCSGISAGGVQPRRGQAVRRRKLLIKNASVNIWLVHRMQCRVNTPKWPHRDDHSVRWPECPVTGVSGDRSVRPPIRCRRRSPHVVPIQHRMISTTSTDAAQHSFYRHRAHSISQSAIMSHNVPPLPRFPSSSHNVPPLPFPLFFP